MSLLAKKKKTKLNSNWIKDFKCENAEIVEKKTSKPLQDIGTVKNFLNIASIAQKILQ